ncbi:MAG: PfkB family carbohydrate kinase [Planctomycetia bacterium]
MCVPKVIAVGGACATGIFRVATVPPLPAKELADRMCRIGDGMAISAACACARLGGRAAAWARVGDDAEGIFIRESLAAEGIDISGIRSISGGRSSQAAVIVDGVGQRLVVPFHDPQLDASADWLPLDTLPGAGMVLCDVRWPEGAEAALRAARSRGIPTMIDGDVAPVETLRRLVPLADYAVFSDAGLLALTGMRDVAAALRAVAATHPGHVGATCGPEGYFWVEHETVRHQPPPAVDAVDTLAAGDVFHGALALAILENQPLSEAIRFACVAAALKCGRFGGRLGCPTRSEVEAVLAGTQADSPRAVDSLR